MDAKFFSLKKKLIIISLIVAILAIALSLALIFRQKKSGPLQNPSQWHEYFEEANNARIYLSNDKQELSIVVCVSIAGIECSIHLNHDCTAEQFLGIQELLKDKGVIYKGIVDKPDTEGFPNLTDYLPLVMSSDEMHELWRQLKLEE